MILGVVCQRYFHTREHPGVNGLTSSNDSSLMIVVPLCGSLFRIKEHEITLFPKQIHAVGKLSRRSIRAKLSSRNFAPWLVAKVRCQMVGDWWMFGSCGRAGLGAVRLHDLAKFPHTRDQCITFGLHAGQLSNSLFESGDRGNFLELSSICVRCIACGLHFGHHIGLDQ